MEQVLESLQSIEKRLTAIEEHLGIMKEDCSKMGKHIHFVERTYSILRKPMNYFLRGKELPQIKNTPE